MAAVVTIICIKSKMVSVPNNIHELHNGRNVIYNFRNGLDDQHMYNFKLNLNDQRNVVYKVKHFIDVQHNVMYNFKICFNNQGSVVYNLTHRFNGKPNVLDHFKHCFNVYAQKGMHNNTATTLIVYLMS